MGDYGLLKDIEAGSGASAPAGFAELEGKAYFVASTASAGRELWSTDGTGPGTVLVSDLTPGTASSNISGLVASSEAATPYVSNVSFSPFELVPGSVGSEPDDFVFASGGVTFTAVAGPTAPRTLWFSDNL